MPYDKLGSAETEWAGKRYADIRSIGESEGSILVIPVGSIEQHGHHLPVSTDTILVDAVAHAGAERVDAPLLVTPPVWAGYSPHHLPFGGTLSLSNETFRAVIEDVADTGLENGFDALLVINGHGGNISIVDEAVSTIGVEHPRVEVHGLTYLSFARSIVEGIRDSEAGGMAHGGEFETSLMLHLRPDLVGEERDGTPLDEPYDHGVKDLTAPGPLATYRTFDEYSASGAIGNPELASAEKGARIFEELGDELADVLSQIHEQNTSGE